MMKSLRCAWPVFILLPLIATLLLNPAWNQALFLALHQAARVLPAVFWRLVSAWGEWPTMLALLFTLSWLRTERLPALLFACVSATFLAIALKAGFAEPRPPLVLPAGSVQLLDTLPSSGSFPSGHAMAAAMIATFLYFSGIWRRGLVLVLAAVLIMLSRLAIGVHWPVDVLAGALAGWTVMRLALFWVRPHDWSVTWIRRAQWGLLFVTLTYLIWLQRQPVLHEEFYLRLLIVIVAIATAFWQLLRPGKARQAN
ncbi:phosphatase PAP2 family protein [Neisseriaceae bacterium TC5R-5]|nr:phosphatase PAP2 family protein [Neisseriaceae bacterium TC5R-5]